MKTGGGTTVVAERRNLAGCGGTGESPDELKEESGEYSESLTSSLAG